MTFTRALLRVRLWYFSPGCMSLLAALSFFSLFGFVLFGSCEPSAAAVFAMSFLFLLRFVYLFRTSLS